MAIVNRKYRTVLSGSVLSRNGFLNEGDDRPESDELVWSESIRRVIKQALVDGSITNDSWVGRVDCWDLEDGTVLVDIEAEEDIHDALEAGLPQGRTIRRFSPVVKAAEHALEETSDMQDLEVFANENEKRRALGALPQHYTRELDPDIPVVDKGVNRSDPPIRIPD